MDVRFGPPVKRGYARAPCVRPGRIVPRCHWTSWTSIRPTPVVEMAPLTLAVWAPGGSVAGMGRSASFSAPCLRVPAPLAASPRSGPCDQSASSNDGTARPGCSPAQSAASRCISFCPWRTLGGKWGREQGPRIQERGSGAGQPGTIANDRANAAPLSTGRAEARRMLGARHFKGDSLGGPPDGIVSKAVAAWLTDHGPPPRTTGDLSLIFGYGG
jgi:hypothetical protein